MSLSPDEPIDLDFALPVDTYVHEVLSFSGAPTGWKVTFGGPAHPKAVSWANEAARESLRKSLEDETAIQNGRKIKPSEKTVEEVRKRNVQWVIARIVTWTPVKIGGKVYEYSDENAIELLTKPEMGWAFTQFLNVLSDELSFTKDSSNG